MLDNKRRVNKNKLLKINSLEEKKIIIENYNDSIAKLKIEEEKAVRNNNELAEAITEKNNKLLNYRNEKNAIKKAIEIDVSNLKRELKDLKELLAFNTNHLKIIEATIPEKEEQEKILIESIVKLKDDKIALENEIIEKTENSNKELTETNNNLVKSLEELASAQNQLIAFKEEVEKAKNELERIKETCGIENKVLSIRKQDLDIYEKRLRNKYPNEIINI